MTAPDQIAHGQIGERMPAHHAPEQPDREGGHQSDEQHQADQGAPHSRAHDCGQDHEAGEHEHPLGPAAPAPPGDAGTGAVGQIG